MANGFVRAAGGGIYTRGLDVVMSDDPETCKPAKNHGACGRGAAACIPDDSTSTQCPLKFLSGGRK